MAWKRQQQIQIPLETSTIRSNEFFIALNKEYSLTLQLLQRFFIHFKFSKMNQQFYFC